MSTRRLSMLGVVTVLALTSAALGLITPVAPADQSTGVTTPWATAAQPVGNGWSLNVLDSATLPSTVTVAVAQLHIWGQPPGPESLVSAADGVYSAEFPVTGLQPGRDVASVSWTPFTLGVPTSWSPPVSFTVGGAVCARPPVAVNLPGVDVSYSTHTSSRGV